MIWKVIVLVAVCRSVSSGSLDRLETGRLETDQLETDQLETGQLETDQLESAAVWTPYHPSDYVCNIKGDIEVYANRFMDKHQTVHHIVTTSFVVGKVVLRKLILQVKALNFNDCILMKDVVDLLETAVRGINNGRIILYQSALCRDHYNKLYLKNYYSAYKYTLDEYPTNIPIADDLYVLRSTVERIIDSIPYCNSCISLNNLFIYNIILDERISHIYQAMNHQIPRWRFPIIRGSSIRGSFRESFRRGSTNPNQRPLSKMLFPIHGNTYLGLISKSIYYIHLVSTNLPEFVSADSFEGDKYRLYHQLVRLIDRKTEPIRCYFEDYNAVADVTTEGRGLKISVPPQALRIRMTRETVFPASMLGVRSETVWDHLFPDDEKKPIFQKGDDLAGLHGYELPVSPIDKFYISVYKVDPSTTTYNKKKKQLVSYFVDKIPSDGVQNLLPQMTIAGDERARTSYVPVRRDSFLWQTRTPTKHEDVPSDKLHFEIAPERAGYVFVSE